MTSAGTGVVENNPTALTLRPDEDDERWVQVEEWVRMSYFLVAPKSLVRRITASRPIR